MGESQLRSLVISSTRFTLQAPLLVLSLILADTLVLTVSFISTLRKQEKQPLAP